MIAAAAFVVAGLTLVFYPILRRRNATITPRPNHGIWVERRSETAREAEAA